MDAQTEDLLAEQVAQSAALHLVMRAVIMFAKKEGVNREALLRKWEESGHDILSRQAVHGVRADRLEIFREKAKVRFTDIITTCSIEE
jgi:hypothetical protein